eukprot:CFRG0416T1
MGTVVPLLIVCGCKLCTYPSSENIRKTSESHCIYYEMNTVTVTLFVNDGKLETSTAKSFTYYKTIAFLSLTTQCFERLYELPANSGVALYSQTGKRIFHTNEMSHGDSIVVSGGEPFCELQFAAQMPTWAQTGDVKGILNDLYADQRNNRDSFVGSQGMVDMVRQGLRKVYPPEVDLPSHFSAMVNDVSRANFDIINHSRNGILGSGNVAEQVTQHQQRQSHRHQQSHQQPHQQQHQQQQQQQPQQNQQQGHSNNLSDLFNQIYFPTINVNSTGLGAPGTHTNSMVELYSTPSPNNVSLQRSGSSNRSSVQHVEHSMDKSLQSISHHTQPPPMAQVSPHQVSPHPSQQVQSTMNNMGSQSRTSQLTPTIISPSVTHNGNTELRQQSSPPRESVAAIRASSSSISSRLDQSKIYAAGLSDSGSSGSLGYKGGIPDRVSSHKAAERRSRAKLRDSLKSLCLSIPSLRDVSNPSKAVIMQKASEYIKDTVDDLEKLKSQTDQQKSEKSVLAAEKASIELQMEAASITTVEITDSEDRVVFVDHMWEIVMGFSRHEVVGDLIHSIVDCSSCPFMSARNKQIKTSLQAGEDWRGIMLGSRRDGQAFACEATTTPIPGADSKFQFLTTRKNFHLLATDEQQELCSKQLADNINSSVQVDSEKVRTLIAKASEATNSKPSFVS